MNARNQDVVFNVTGQTLIWDAPEGRPSSITSVTVFEAHTGDNGTAEGATTGSAAVETNPDTTFDAASGDAQADSRLCNIAATTGCEVGREYLATNAVGVKEWIEVVEVDSGVSIVARNPLANDYTTGDTLESSRISIAVDSTWVADENNLTDGADPNPGYRVRWVYVVGGVTYVHDSYLSLVRYAGAHGVTPSMLDALIPSYQDSLPTYHREDQGQRLIDEAYEQVKWDLHGIERDDSDARDLDALDRLVMLKFKECRAEERIISEGEAPYIIAKQKFDSFFENLFKIASKVDFAGTSSGASSGAPKAANVWRGR